MRVLWVLSDDAASPAIDTKALESLTGFAIETVAGPAEALADLRACACDAVIADFPNPGWQPEDLIEEIRRINSMLPVIIRDFAATIASAVRLARLGAHAVLGPETSVKEIAASIEDAVQQRRDRESALFCAAPADEPWKRFLVGESRAMRSIGHVIRLVGPRRSTVLITGETGTGKEMIARAIHMASARSHLPMVAVNCNALPDTLLEAELFGHVRGAFTGAVSQRIGRFEQAHRSTLFLDEIGDMPLDLQAKLLRVLQEREFQRLGSSETLRLDIRLIAATNMNIEERIRQGRFREDLYYRLNVVPMAVPPLRDRLADVPLLVEHFIDKICRLEDIPAKRVSREALDRLRAYAWPGNVRQLENAVEMAIALSGDEKCLYPGDFPLPAAKTRLELVPTAPAIRVPDDGLDFERTVSRIERSILDQALQRTRGNKKLAAEMLRLKRTTLAAKLKSLELAAV